MGEWAAYFIDTMMPVVYDTEKGYRSLEAAYQEMSLKFFGKDHDERKRLRKVREKILGPDVIAEYDNRYSELSLIHKIGLDVWEKMNVQEKGKWIAFHTLSGMEEFIRNCKVSMSHQKK